MICKRCTYGHPCPQPADDISKYIFDALDRQELVRLSPLARVEAIKIIAWAHDQVGDYPDNPRREIVHMQLLVEGVVGEMMLGAMRMADSKERAALVLQEFVAMLVGQANREFGLGMRLAIGSDTGTK